MNTKDFKFELPLHNIDLTRLQAIPNELLSLIPTEVIDALKRFIFDQLQNKDGAPSPTDFTVTKFEFNPSKSMGKFRIEFKIDRQFCCADTTACSSDYIDFTFHSNSTQFLATGTFFDWTLDN